MANDDNKTSLSDFKFYHYNPSEVAAIIFIVLFFITAIAHTYQLFRKRTWYFIPFLIGGFFEAVGYIGRAISSTESPNWTIGAYVVQSILILIAPAFFAASIYMILGRIIRLLDAETHSPIRANWLTKVFVAGDVISFLAQSSGGGMLAKAKTNKDVNLGQNIITAGLGIQVLFFGIFVIVAGIFHVKINAVPTAKSRSTTVPWQRYLFVLYAASMLILVRSVFRIIEYVMGQDGVLLSTEVYLYVFDATLMFLTMVLFNVWHPSAIITKGTLRNVDLEGCDETEGSDQADSYGLRDQRLNTKVSG